MLSSGLGLHLGNVKIFRKVFDYTFDLTSSGSTIWERIDTNGDISIQLGQNPSGESTNDWLAATYGADASAITGIQFDVGDVGFSGGRIGDIGAISYKLYLDGDWDGGDDISWWNHSLYNTTQGSTSVSLPQDEIITVDIPYNRTVGANTYAKIPGWSEGLLTKYVKLLNGHAYFASDRPNTGAVLYIKDFNFQVWR